MTTEERKAFEALRESHRELVDCLDWAWPILKVWLNKTETMKAMEKLNIVCGSLPERCDTALATAHRITEGAEG